MKCDICHEREANCEIDGWEVCGDPWCRYGAWKMPDRGGRYRAHLEGTGDADRGATEVKPKDE